MPHHPSHPRLAAALAPLLLAASALAQPSCGDCDRNGSLDILDGLRAAQMGAQILPVGPGDADVCDVDSSGSVSVLDALRVAQASAQLNPALVCPPDPNTPPQAASASVPGSPVAGTVMLTYSLLDAESHPCSVVVAYSLDGGATYSPAHQGAGGEGSMGLISSPGGEMHTYAWDSQADLGPTLEPSVILRVTPSDIVPGTPAVTLPFVVDNQALNTPPVAQSASVPGSPVGGTVTVSYMLVDAESDPCSLAVELSVDGGQSYAPTTPGAGGDGTSNLPSSPGGVPHTYAWDSLADLGTGSVPGVMLRVTPSDGLAAGTPAVTTPFDVENAPANARPEVAPATPVGNPILYGFVTLEYTLTDAESDPCSLEVEYSTGMSFLPATAGPGGDGSSNLASSPGGTLHTWTWDSVADLGATLASTVTLRVRAVDAGGAGSFTSTGVFLVDNNPISFASAVLPMLTNGGSVGCTHSSCHDNTSPPLGLTLTSYAGISAGSINGPVYIPGNSAGSRIICKLSGTQCGVQMPFGGTPWTPSMISVMARWIDQGGMDN